MNLREVKPDMGEIKRWQLPEVTDSKGRYAYVAIFTVLYGYRLRGGWVGDMASQVDWCMGAVQPDGHLAQLVIDRLVAMIHERGGFDGIPQASRIKPMWLDLEFMAEIGLGRNASQES